MIDTTVHQLFSYITSPELKHKLYGRALYVSYIATNVSDNNVICYVLAQMVSCIAGRIKQA